jgi:hypothetical protein
MVESNVTLRELVTTPQISDSGGGGSTEIGAATQEATPLETSAAANAPSEKFIWKNISILTIYYFSQKADAQLEETTLTADSAEAAAASDTSATGDAKLQFFF